MIPKGRKGKKQHADSYKGNSKLEAAKRLSGRSQTASLCLHSQVTVDEEQGHKYSLETVLVKGSGRKV